MPISRASSSAQRLLLSSRIPAALTVEHDRLFFAIDDEGRAELRRTALERQLAEFDIEAQLIGFVQEAAYAYWDWVAAGRGQKIAQRVLDLLM